jgi:hypothetical protein
VTETRKQKVEKSEGFEEPFGKRLKLHAIFKLSKGRIQPPCPGSDGRSARFQ